MLIYSNIFMIAINVLTVVTSALVGLTVSILAFAAALILRNLPAGIKKAYILYIAIIMIGLSYISFMWLDRSIASYLIINTLMLGGFGVCDLFWWSVLGSYLDYHENPARIFGIGLSMNVLGILIGGLIGNSINVAENYYMTTSVLALVVVFTALIILPLLNGELIRHLKKHEFVMKYAGLADGGQSKAFIDFQVERHFTEKETEVVKLLLGGYTYKEIAKNLYISENTIKYHIKNIYQKLGINNKMDLIKMFSNNEKLK
ncbi:MAG: helix-turn-helix transcriptional regulator [Gracilibacteraceae bacterium]|nr:helix-turn-helix transcriptional regulator [Gracilibacteraceae bacterium]